jgi:hypothetical protein
MFTHKVGVDHDEPFVFISPRLYEKISQYGKTTLPYAFGWWQYAEPLIKDHEKERMSSWASN